MTKAEVRRFDLGSDPWEEGAAGMEESERGEYVLFGDYDALAAQLAAAERERDASRESSAEWKRAAEFYRLCKADPRSAETGAMRDAIEWLCKCAEQEENT